jgi:hypothetical protein
VTGPHFEKSICSAGGFWAAAPQQRRGRFGLCGQALQPLDIGPHVFQDNASATRAAPDPREVNSEIPGQFADGRGRRRRRSARRRFIRIQGLELRLGMGGLERLAFALFPARAPPRVELLARERQLLPALGTDGQNPLTDADFVTGLDVRFWRSCRSTLEGMLATAFSFSSSSTAGLWTLVAFLDEEADDGAGIGTLT